MRINQTHFRWTGNDINGNSTYQIPYKLLATDIYAAARMAKKYGYAVPARFNSDNIEVKSVNLIELSKQLNEEITRVNGLDELAETNTAKHIGIAGNVTLVYFTDNHHSKDSRELLCVCDNLLSLTMNIIDEATEFNVDLKTKDLVHLYNEYQTQGLCGVGEFILVGIKLNSLIE